MFLHGYLSDGKSFVRQTEYFKRFFNVYAPDLKGFGGNADMPYPYNLDDYINDVKQYIRANGLVRPHVVAHSFGARIALKAAATDKNLFGKLVLTGAAGLKPKNTLKKRARGAAFRFLKRFVAREKLTRFYSSDYLALSDVMRRSFVKIVSETLDGYLCDIENPVLIVFGEKDKETPLYMAKKLEKNIRGAKSVVLPQAGHFCFVDKPVKFNMEVREFLLS